MTEMRNPLATAVVRWVPADQGGRRSGPPTADVYAATAVFVQGGEVETAPGWPATADQVSILIKPTSRGEDAVDLAEIGFLAPDLVRPFLYAGAELLVMEGPRVVANAEIAQVLPA
jgi:hypothetical protein